MVQSSGICFSNNPSLCKSQKGTAARQLQFKSPWQIKGKCAAGNSCRLWDSTPREARGQTEGKGLTRTLAVLERMLWLRAAEGTWRFTVSISTALPGTVLLSLPTGCCGQPCTWNPRGGRQKYGLMRMIDRNFKTSNHSGEYQTRSTAVLERISLKRLRVN